MDNDIMKVVHQKNTLEKKSDLEVQMQMSSGGLQIKVLAAAIHVHIVR